MRHGRPDRSEGVSWLHLPVVLLLVWWTIGFLDPDRRYWFFLDWVNLWWFGENFIGIAVYMAVRSVSAATHHLGVLVMLAATAWAACFILPAARREALARRIGEILPVLRPLLEAGERSL